MTDEQMDALVQTLEDDAAEHKEFFPSDKSYQNMHRGAIQAITQLRTERDTLAAQVEVLREGLGKIAARTIQPKKHNPQQDMAYQLDGYESIALDTLAKADAMKGGSND